MSRLWKSCTSKWTGRIDGPVGADPCVEAPVSPASGTPDNDFHFICLCFSSSRYYDQLNSLEAKIPSAENQIPFKWKDAFDKGGLFVGRMSLSEFSSSLTECLLCFDILPAEKDDKRSLTFPVFLPPPHFTAQASLAFEKICVMFNIGSMLSQIGANQNVEFDDGLKIATRYFQQAAGVFQYVKDHVLAAIQQEPTPDLYPDALSALITLMMAQAQEVLFMKAAKGAFRLIDWLIDEWMNGLIDWSIDRSAKYN